MEICNPSLKIGDLTSIKSDYSNIYRDPLIKIL